jgi:hypothetical protein
MIRSVVSRVLISVCVFGGPLALACSNGDSSPEESASTGTVTMPLITTVGDNTYRLNAVLEIYGPTFTFLSTSDDPAETSLSTPLPTGDYTAYLSNWSLEILDASGNFVPVSATLTSAYYANFTIFNQSTSTIAFQFETDGVVVTVGAGRLNVNFGITEVPAVCAIFGSDCAAGSWCAPPELTGSPLSCIGEGAVPVGQVCLSPRDCVANASCFDFGGGAVCGALCAPAEFDAACASGGTCIPVGAEYGVCVPEGGTLPDDGGSGGSAGMGGFAGKGGVGGRSPMPTAGASAGGTGGAAE